MLDFPWLFIKFTPALSPTRSAFMCTDCPPLFSFDLLPSTPQLSSCIKTLMLCPKCIFKQTQVLSEGSYFDDVTKV